MKTLTLREERGLRLVGLKIRNEKNGKRMGGIRGGKTGGNEGMFN